MKNLTNYDRNAHEQALIDLLEHDASYGTMTLKEALEHIQSSPSEQKALTRLWNHHLYPDDSIKWWRQYARSEIFSLSPESIKMLLLFTCYMAQGTGLVSILKKDAITLTGYTDYRYRSVMKELLDRDCLRIALKTGPHDPPVYAVNPRFAQKGLNFTEFDRGTPGKDPLTEANSLFSYRGIGIRTEARVVPDPADPDRKIRFTRIVITEPKKNLQEPDTPEDPPHNKKILHPENTMDGGDFQDPPEEKLPFDE